MHSLYLRIPGVHFRLASFWSKIRRVVILEAKMLTSGETAGVAIGTSILGLIVLVIILILLRKWLRGPNISARYTKRLDGKIIAITGANTGIGKETAKDLAGRGAKILVLCRNVSRGKNAISDIVQELNGKGDLDFIQCDLADLSSVKEAANKIIQNYSSLDMLINNAGVMMCPYMETKDGFEMQFGTNHLGHFLLTDLLLPLIKKTASESDSRPRIINVSSLAHERGDMNWSDLMNKSNYSRVKVYGQSKLSNVLHAIKLSEILKDDKISVYSLHPGVINTELGRHIENMSVILGYLMKLLVPFIKTSFHGAQTTLYCALDDSIEHHSGRYYSDCKEKLPAPNALKKDYQDRLWEESLKLVKK